MNIKKALKNFAVATIIASLSSSAFAQNTNRGNIHQPNISIRELNKLPKNAQTIIQSIQENTRIAESQIADDRGDTLQRIRDQYSTLFKILRINEQLVRISQNLERAQDEIKDDNEDTLQRISEQIEELEKTLNTLRVLGIDVREAITRLDGVKSQLK